MNEKNNDFIGYLKFFGPSVEEGRIDIDKLGRSLVAFDRLFHEYSKKERYKEKVSLKLGKIKKNCTEVNIYFEQMVSVVQPVAQTLPYLMVAKAVGIAAFGEKFFGTIGEQLALRLFAKGKGIEKVRDVVKDGKVFVLIRNAEGDEKEFLKDVYENQYNNDALFRKIAQLKKGSEESLEIGYYKNNNPKIISKINYKQKEYFASCNELKPLEDRLDEEFEDAIAKKAEIIGKFVDYYGMAHKYHFSFQSRKDQEGIGKQKILCMLNGPKISEVIDLLKPENQENNVCISGEVNTNNEGKIDKIKIKSIRETESMQQQKLVW